MIPLTLSEVAAATGGTVTRDDATTIAEVTTDSRTTTPGALFVALRGEHADGHDYVDAAVAAGAGAVLVERAPESPVPAVVVDDTWTAIADLAGEVRRRVDPLVVAITGSVGKTTTKDMTAAAFEADRPTVAAQASFNNELGVPLTLLGLEHDTEALVVEIGARGLGHIAGLTPVVRPDVSIVTAVAGVHLELFGDIETVAVAKAELVEALDADGTAVLNADDHRVAAMAGVTRAAVVRFGSGPDADVRAAAIRLDRLARADFEVVTPWGRAAVRLPVAGRHNVSNALAAIAAAGSRGVDVAVAADAISASSISAWRGEIEEIGGVTVLNDAYNANPTSVLGALETLIAIEADGRRWAVLGVMAEIGRTHDREHERVGAAAADAGVDVLVAVGDEVRAMARAAREAGLEVVEVPDAEAATALLRDEVSTGDAVLVKASRVAGLEAVRDGLVRALEAEAGA